MADFLASFNLAPESSGPSNTWPCASVDELQLHLRRVLDAATAPTRAEHVSVVMELRGSAQFTLSLADGDGLDPALGAAAAPLRVVDAASTLTNQPQDDPVLQRSVARQIIAAVSETDGSTWAVREVSRSAQGWTFTYVCKDSYQEWSRQHSKNPSKAIIGEFSMMEPDPKLSSRPAFDCRGCVIISFSRSNRSLIIKYDHTPLHRTVAQLREYFKPPPRPVAEGAPQPKTPKRAATPRKRRDSAKTPGEGAKPRKRKKQNDGRAQPVAPEGGITDSSQGFAGDESAANATQGPSSAATGSFPLNVSSSEVTRRREVATKMLEEAAVPPSTLSAEQFNIFSNQSPELQKESLSMLVKYGAERLRIVHPSNKEGSAAAAASAASTPVQTTQPTPSGPTTTKELVPRAQGKRKRGSAAAGVVEGASSTVESGNDSPAIGRRGGKSRLACYQCKDRKVKCPKDTPGCTECQEAGLECEYALPRPKKKKTAADESQLDGEDHNESDRDETEDHSSYPQMPVADLLTSSLDGSSDQPGLQAHTLFSPGSGLEFPRSDLSHMSLQALSTASGLVLPHGVVHDGSNMGVGSASSALMPQQRANERVETSSPEPKRRRPQGTQGTERSRLPTKRASQNGHHSHMPNPLAPANWANPVDPAMETVDPALISSALPPQAARNPRSRQSDQRRSINSPQMMERLQQPSTLTQTANLQAQQSPRAAAALQVQDRASPLQPSGDSRASSRQGHRSQTRTPVGGQPVGRGRPMPSGQTERGASHGQPGSVGGISSSNNYEEYSETGSGASNEAARIPYVPYSQQTSAVRRPSQPAFDYDRETPTTMPTAASSASAMAGSFSTNTANSNQWPASQGRSTQSFNNDTGYNSTGTYGQPSSYSQWTASQQNLDLKGQSRKQGRMRDQQANYPSHHGQSQSQSHSGNQSDVFYNFNNQGGSYTPANSWM